MYQSAKTGYMFDQFYVCPDKIVSCVYCRMRWEKGLSEDQHHSPVEPYYHPCSI